MKERGREKRERKGRKEIGERKEGRMREREREREKVPCNLETFY